jgi:flagellar M-ring protein FliF
VDQEYYTSDGMETGLPSSTRDYSSTSTTGTDGVPGTDSNDNTTYVTEDDNGSVTETTEQTTDYDNSLKTTEETSTIGGINYESSSLAAVMSTYHVYSEKTMKASGQLDDMTFEEFEAANSDKIRLDVDEDLVTMVANATGIPAENISLIAYEVPVFSYDEDDSMSVTDFLPIILAVLIMLMLGYVVFRSTRREKEPETAMEPELSVESLLESTREVQEEELEDIGFNEKSETRILIEKFVDENPEAAASLLRNWLNEEWE